MQVSNRHVAVMFLRNMHTWKQQPFIRENYSSSTMDSMEAELSALADTSGDESHFEWEMRQLVFDAA